MGRLREWAARFRRAPPLKEGQTRPSADAALEKLAARIAHDVLSPLQAVSYALDLIGRTQDPAVLRRCELNGRAGLKRAQAVAEGLFDFARAQTPPEPGASAKLPPLVAEVLAELKEQATEEGVELRTGELSPCAVTADPRTVAMVLRHLVRNSIQYMDGGEERWVEVRVRPGLGHAVVEVEDTAGGIPEEARSTLFEPYVRVQRNKKTGLGLGLSTVKRVVEAHGGEVHVSFRGRSGVVFTLEWPHARWQEAPEGERPPYLT